MNYSKKAFTLIELLIVITIIGILSTLLFRTLGDMISANGKIQQEKIMTQELITLQTTINNIAEQYPIIDMQAYKIE
jgi:prepilin-type N-terminal cleavage/methylation domain-containing protein